MANYGANLYLVPIVLKVKSSAEITALCCVNNKLNGQKYNYALPVQFVKGFYEINFFADIREWKNPQDMDKKQLDLEVGE